MTNVVSVLFAHCSHQQRKNMLQFKTESSCITARNLYHNLAILVFWSRKYYIGLGPKEKGLNNIYLMYMYYVYIWKVRADITKNKTFLLHYDCSFWL